MSFRFSNLNLAYLGKMGWLHHLKPNDFQTKPIESEFTGWPQLRGVNTLRKQELDDRLVDHGV